MSRAFFSRAEEEIPIRINSVAICNPNGGYCYLLILHKLYILRVYKSLSSRTRY